MIFLDQQESNYEINYDSLNDTTIYINSSEEGDQLGGDQSPVYSFNENVVYLD